MLDITREELMGIQQAAANLRRQVTAEARDELCRRVDVIRDRGKSVPVGGSMPPETPEVEDAGEAAEEEEKREG